MRVFHKSLNVAVTGNRDTVKKTLPLHVGRGPVPRHASCCQTASPLIDQARLILICSGSGEPELQGARCLPVGDAHHLSLRAPNV